MKNLSNFEVERRAVLITDEKMPEDLSREQGQKEAFSIESNYSEVAKGECSDLSVKPHSSQSATSRDFNISFKSWEWIDSLDLKGASRPITLSFDNSILSGIESKSNYRILNRVSKTLYFYTSPNDDYVKSVINYARKKGYVRVSFGSYYGPEQSEILKHLRNEYVIDLTGTTDDIFSRMSKRSKRYLKKDHGLTFVKTNSDKSVNDLLSGMDAVFDRRGGNYNPFYLPFVNHQSIKKLLNKGVCSLYAFIKDEKTVCSILIYEAYPYAFAIYLGASIEAYETKSVLHMHWEVMKIYNQLGYKELNLAGAPDKDKAGAGVIQFKKSIGAKEVKRCGGGFEIARFPWNIIRKMYLKFR